MSKIDSWMVFLLVAAFLCAISFAYPEAFGDSNSFMDQFVNHEFLNFMGVFVAITLASTANIYIELRKKEVVAGREFLHRTKSAVRRSAFSLIWALSIALVLVVVKPLLPDVETCRALTNSIALAIILWSILVILDITKLAFRLVDAEPENSPPEGQD